MNRSAASGREQQTHEHAWMYALVGIGAAIFFYLHLFRFPATPVFHVGDQFNYLEHAERMLHGEILYRDLFQFNLPGTEYLYYSLFRCLGIRLWIAALASFIADTAVTLFIYSLSRVVLGGAAALLPVIAFLAICQRTSIDGSHHWYSTTIVLLAINLVARARNPVSLAIAGALLGVATIFTSTLGISVAVGVSLFFLWRFRGWRNASRSIVTLLVPLALVLGVTLMYLARLAGPETLYRSILVFPLRYYASGDANSFSVFFDEWHGVLPLRLSSFLDIALWCAENVAVPIIFLAFIARRYQRGAADLHNSQRNKVTTLYAFAGIFALLPVLHAPSAPRLSCSAAFAYIVATVMLQDLGLGRFIVRAVAVAGVVALAEIAVAATRPTYMLSGPRGAMAFLHQDEYNFESLLLRIAQPGDRLFGDPEANFALGLRNPARIQWVEPDGYTRPEQVRELVLAIEQNPTRMIVWSEEQATSSNSEDSLAPLRIYLKEHYHKAAHGLLLINAARK